MANELPLVFATITQQHRYDSLSHRHMVAQKFVDIDSLRELFVYDGVRALFNNIGWGGILNLQAIGYRQLTLEFLSSVKWNARTREITFRMQNRPYRLHVDQICELIVAPTVNVYSRGSVTFDIQKQNFWELITGKSSYEPSKAKASRIIHPVLKTAHRILASVLFPQAEISKASKKELELLWCLVTRPDRTPHFGEWFTFKVLKMSRSSSGAIHCGGIVSILAGHPSINLQIHPGAAIIQGDNLLTTPVLENMQLFRRSGSRFLWTIAGAGSAHVNYLRVDRRNSRLLRLQNPISRTIWNLESNLGEPAPNADSSEEEEEEEEEEEDEEDNQQPRVDSSGAGPSGTAGGSQFPQYPPYHDMYMEQFNNLNTTCQNFNTRLTNAETNYSAFRSDFNEFRATYHTNRASEQTQLDNITSLLSGIRDWTINQPGYHPPPPPEF